VLFISQKKALFTMYGESNSSYIISNHLMVVKNELEKILSNLRYYPKVSGKDTLYPNKDSKSELSEYKSESLPLEPT
jgi:hypothetical protein